MNQQPNEGIKVEQFPAMDPALQAQTMVQPVMQQQPMMQQQQPMMMQQPMIQQQQQPMMQAPQQGHNLQGGIQVQLPDTGARPVQSGNGITTFGDAINIQAIIFLVVGIVMIVVSPLSMCITSIIGIVFVGLAVFVFKNTIITFDDNNRTISIVTQGAIIPSVTLGGGENRVGYDDVQDFAVRVIPGMYINNQPAASLIMVMKDGRNVTVKGTTMMFSAQALGTRMKNLLAAKVNDPH